MPTVIHVVATGEVVALQLPRLSLETLQTLVGGQLEGVYLGDGVTLYVNESGMVQGLPPNRVFRRFDGNRVPVYGNAVLLGFNPATGEDYGLSAEQVEKWMAVVSAAPRVNTRLPLTSQLAERATLKARPPLGDGPLVHMTAQLNNMPAWMLRILADAAPDKAPEVILRTARLRDDQVIRAIEGRPEILSGCEAIWIALAAWIQSGSSLIELDEGSKQILDTLTTPRFYALTAQREQPGGLGSRVYVLRFASETYGATDVFVWPSYTGPILTVISNPAGVNFGLETELCGEWDHIRWQAACAPNSGIHPYDLQWLARSLNAVAAVEESREILRRATSAKTKKNKRKLRSRRHRQLSQAAKPITYWLDANALDAWTERTASPTSATPAPPSPNREPTGTRRLHQCREHTRRMWVKTPKDDEAVLGTKTGKIGTLYCVQRRVEAHARGEGVRPQARKLTPLR